jgi:aquaporin Z
VTAPSSRVLVAEVIGTAILVIGGVGSAVLATGAFFADGSIGVLGVALAFGISLLVVAYAFGPISGAHLNPAVTVGLVLAGKLEARAIPTYLAGQVIGALVGGLTIWGIAAGARGGFDPSPANFAVNGWGSLSPGGFGLGSVALAEVVMTALLVLVVLGTTQRRFPPAAGGLAVGMTLTLIHLISIPVSNTSVNPVRSLASAAFAGGDALTQLWAFVVFPLIGGVLGALIWRFLDHPSPVEADTLDLPETTLGDPHGPRPPIPA